MVLVKYSNVLVKSWLLHNFAGYFPYPNPSLLTIKYHWRKNGSRRLACLDSFPKQCSSTHGMRNETDFRLNWLDSYAQCSSLFVGRVSNTSRVCKQESPQEGSPARFVPRQHSWRTPERRHARPPPNDLSYRTSTSPRCRRR